MTQRSLPRKFFSLLAVAAALVAVPAVAQAQEKTQPFEGAVTFTYVRAQNMPQALNTTINMVGGSVSGAYYAGPRFGVVGEYSGVNQNNDNNTNNRLTIETFVFGPRIVFPAAHSHISPYVQVLAGAAHSTGPAATTGSASSGYNANYLSYVSNAIAVTAGAGLDFRITRHFTFRAVQAEYYFTGLNNNGNNRENNIKFDSGIAYRF